MNNRFMYIGSVYLLEIKEGKVLLLKRANTGFMDGYYGLPAGHLDGNETAREGCAREMREELGISIDPTDLEVVHVMHRKAAVDERIDFFMTAKKYTGEITNTEPEKCGELAWFPLDQLPENIIPYVAKAIEKSINKIFYSEFGY